MERNRIQNELLDVRAAFAPWVYQKAHGGEAEITDFMPTTRKKPERKATYEDFARMMIAQGARVVKKSVTTQ